MLVLDTQGLFSPQKGFDIDVKTFALAVLLSSNLIYNQVGHISDQSFENFSILQMLTNEIKYKGTTLETGRDFSQFFPNMTWVLRDFEMGFKSLTPDSYLEQCLEQEKAYNDEGTYKNSIRQLLKQFFPKIECHALAKAQQAEYKNQSKALLESIMSNPKVKQINKRPLSGCMLLNLLLDYADCFNNSQAPVVVQSFQRVVAIESDRFLNELFDQST